MGCDVSREGCHSPAPLPPCPELEDPLAPTGLSAPSPAQIAPPSRPLFGENLTTNHQFHSPRHGADNFFVVSYLPNSFAGALEGHVAGPGGDKPCVVYQYPEHSLLPQNELLADFCFPNAAGHSDALSFNLPSMRAELEAACFGTAASRSSNGFVFLLNRTVGAVEGAELEDLYGVGNVRQ